MRFATVVIALLVGHGLGGSAPAAATPLTWQMHDLRFADGGTVTGFFVFDAALGLIGTYALQVRGGDTAVFPEVDFTSDNSEVLPGHASQAFTFALPVPSGRRDLRLVFAEPLTEVPATRTLVLTGHVSVDCYNCDPFRAFVDGRAVSAVVATIPWSHSALVLAVGSVGLAAMGWRVRRRRQEPEGAR